ncbi:MAG: PAS domain S-box protein [Methanoregula sp.]
MKIRTQFIISVVVFIGIFLILSLSVISSMQEVDRMTLQMEIADRITLDAYELNQISNDYLLYGNERQRVQWESKNAALSDDLSLLDTTRPEEQELIRNIRANQQHLKEIFSEISLSVQETEANGNAPPSTAFIRQSWSRIAVQNMGIAFDASRLSQIIRTELERDQKVHLILTIVLMGAVSLILVSIFLILGRRILGAVSELEAGTRIIGSGDLDFRIPENGDDEFRYLASSFNTMTANRKAADGELQRKNEELYASYEQLTATEEELRENYEKLAGREKALQESEQKNRNIIETAQEGIAICVPEGGFVFVNQKMADMLGYSREEIVGRSTMDFMVPGEDGRIVQVRADLRAGKKIQGEFRWRRKDGSVFWTLAHSSPINDTTGRHTGNLVMHSDITARKHTEQIVSLTARIYQIANQAGSLQEMLDGFVDEFMAFSGCEAVGIRLLDGEGNIPYQAHKGFPMPFYESETPLSIKSDECMCIYVIKGTINPGLPVATPNGSFWCNGTSRFLATVSEEDKGHTRNVCNAMGYESVALIPIRTSAGILGLVQFNDHRENMVPLDMVRTMEDVALPLGETIRRKQAEESLRESEERYRNLFETMTQGVVYQDSSGKITEANPAAESILGLSLDQMQGRTSVDPRWEAIREDGLAFPGDQYPSMAALRTGKPITGVTMGIRNPRDDRLHWIWIAATPQFLPGMTTPFRVYTTFTDITGRKAAEDELKESESKYRTLVENIPEKIFIKNSDLVYVSCNDLYARDLGIMPGTIAGKNDFEFYPRDLAEKYRADDRAVMDAGEVRTFEERYVADGNESWISTIKTPIRDETGTITGVLGIFHDITSRKLMEAEIRSLNTVLEQRVIDRTSQLNKTLAEKDLLLKEVHHRVKNNLQIIISLLRLQKHQIADTATLHHITDSESRIRSMAIVHEKLYRSTDLTSIDFDDYIKTLVNQLILMFEVNKGQVRIAVDMKGITVDINQAIPLGLIMNELVSNAMKYAFPEGKSGEITISGSCEKNSMLFTVRDTGAGIPADFDWKNTKTLGLHIVTMLTDQLNGTVELERDGGTLFRLTIPAKREER